MGNGEKGIEMAFWEMESELIHYKIYKFAFLKIMRLGSFHFFFTFTKIIKIAIYVCTMVSAQTMSNCFLF
jgi:hypothetical protein